MFRSRASLLLAAMAVLLLAGCARPTEGNFLIVQEWDKKFRNEVNAGLEFVLIDNAIEIYGRERLITISDARPKDSEGVMLQDLDLTIGVMINKDKAVDFLRTRGDITHVGGDVYVLGENYIKRDAGAMIGETIKNYTSEFLLSNKRVAEDKFKTDLQAELDSLYGEGTFKITEIKFANIIVAPSIEERLQAVALINSEATKAQATMKVLDTRRKTQIEEMRVLADVARASGLTVDQVLEARRLDIIREMPAGASTLVVNADPAK